MQERRRTLLGLVYTPTMYNITEEMVTVRRGLFKRYTYSCYMYKIDSVVLKTTLLGRLLGLGTITCKLGDEYIPEIELKNIRNAENIYDAILRTSEADKLKRIPSYTIMAPPMYSNAYSYVDEVVYFGDII